MVRNRVWRVVIWVNWALPYCQVYDHIHIPGYPAEEAWEKEEEEEEGEEEGDS